jgi:RNA polymerase sigma factor (sigma-70 family)
VRTEEAELVERARRGDVPAYSELVRRHQQLAFRTAYAVCGNAADAEDAAQEAFVKAHRALDRFRSGAPLRPWLLRIVANEARNRRRSAGRREHLAVRAAPRVPAAADVGPETAVLLADERARLAEALDRLEAPQREVVLLRHVLELSEAECAAVLGCRPGTVKSRLSRGLARLRADLEAGHA